MVAHRWDAAPCTMLANARVAGLRKLGERVGARWVVKLRWFDLGEN